MNNEKNVTIVNESVEDQINAFDSNMVITISHLLKVAAQPERFDTSWMTSINKGINNGFSRITNPTAIKRIKDKTFEEYKKRAIEKANSEMVNKKVTNDQVTNLINTFKNHVSNLQDKEKVSSYIASQIDNSDIPDMYKKQYKKYIK